MKSVLIQINSACKSLFNWHPDKTVRQAEHENLCCGKMKEFGYLTWPEKGIIRLNINYCPTCGQKLQRGERG